MLPVQPRAGQVQRSSGSSGSGSSGSGSARSGSSSSGSGGGAPAGGAAAGLPPGECKLEVAANELGSLFGLTSWYHLHIIHTNPADATASEYYFRGGPSGGGAGSSRSSAEMSGGSSRSSSEGSSGSGSNSSRSSDSSSGGGPWGTITTEHGAYVPSSIDYEPGAPRVEVARGPNVCAMRQQLASQMTSIQGMNVPYSPLGPNSNSVVFTALRNIGVTPRVPSGVWAPGKDSPLQ